MYDVVIYRCPLCGKEYHTGRASIGISPNEIHCHECEGTATAKYIEPYNEQFLEFLLVKPNWKMKERYRKTENRWYRRYGFSERECDMLFEYEEKWIADGGLILIKKV